MKKSLVILFVLINSIGFSQLTKTNYTPLKCEGEIPSAFLASADQKFKDQVIKSDKETDKKSQKDKEAYYEAVNYRLDRVLLSGDVLFGDTLTKYVNKIADDLLKDDPQLRSELSFFTFKSPYVNAFSTDQGYICVNVGLIAQVANEAELAYVMAHEIVHFREKHNTQEFIESELIRKGQGDYKETNHHDRINAYYQYSKDLETEADKEGLKMLANSSYNPIKAKGLFDVLLYSYLPFDEEEFDPAFLGNANFEFPQRMLLDSTKEIKVRDEIDDSKSTHPNIKKRRKSTYKYFKKMRGHTDDKKTYLHSKAEFDYVRDIARFEVIRLNNISHRYDRAIYNNFLLDKKYPNNAYLKKCLAISLEGALRYKEDGFSSDAMSSYKKVEGSSQSVSYWLKKIKKRDLAVITASKTYEAYKANPGDKTIQTALHRNLQRIFLKYDMFEEDFIVRDVEETEDSSDDMSMVEETPLKEKKETAKKKKSTDDFFGDDDDDNYEYVEDKQDSEKKKKEEAEDEDIDDFFENKYGSKKKKTTTTTQKDSEKSKYDKIKERKKQEEEEEEEKRKEFRKFVFYDQFNEEAFVEAFEKASSDVPKELSPSEQAKLDQQKRKEEKTIAKKGHSLGVNTLAVMEPMYYVIDDRVDDRHVLYVESEKKKMRLEELINSTALKAGLDVNLLTPKTLDPTDTEQFNAIMKLKEWVNEYQNHEIDSAPSMVRMELGDISSALGTKYIALPQLFNVKMSKNPTKYIFSMFYVVTIPWAISKIASPNEATYYRMLVIDIDALTREMDQEYLYRGRDSDATIKGCLYNTFIQVKRNPK